LPLLDQSNRSQATDCRPALQLMCELLGEHGINIPNNANNYTAMKKHQISESIESWTYHLRLVLFCRSRILASSPVGHF
jgi:hypothetical protein